MVGVDRDVGGLGHDEKEKGDRLLCRGSILQISEVYASKSSLSPFFLAFGADSVKTP
jgi:hypothetical protein